MNNFEKIKNIQNSLLNYRNELIKYEGKIHTKKVMVELDKIIKECA